MISKIPNPLFLRFYFTLLWVLMYLQEIFVSFGISNITLSGHIQNVATMACRLPQDWFYELYSCKKEWIFKQVIKHTWINVSLIALENTVILHPEYKLQRSTMYTIVS